MLPDRTAVVASRANAGMVSLGLGKWKEWLMVTEHVTGRQSLRRRGLWRALVNLRTANAVVTKSR